MPVNVTLSVNGVLVAWTGSWVARDLLLYSAIACAASLASAAMHLLPRGACRRLSQRHASRCGAGPICQDLPAPAG